MKKILIALPLVLIMILSMVPVMAANKTINVPVTYYKTPDQKEVLKTETRAIEVDEAILGDKAKLEAAVVEAIKAFGFPTLETDKQQPAWTVKATVKAQSQGAKTYSLVTEQNPANLTLEKVLADLQGLVKFDNQDLSVKEAGYTFATKALLTRTNAIAKKIAAGTALLDTEKNLKLATGDTGETADAAIGEYNYVTEKAGAVSEAEASAVAYPNCFVDPKKPVEKWCPELCSNIVVRIWDVANQYELEGFRRVYEVDPHKLPTYDGILYHYMKNFFPANKYQVLKTWNNRDFIEKPEWIEKDCVIWINVVPLFQKVNVAHILMDCCETLDGEISYSVFKKFWEANVAVPFIEYQSTLVVNSEKAAEWANTRLQKVNATDFVFVNAVFDDGINLDNYMTGNVYDMDGNLVDIVVNELPTIELIYHRVGCDKEEQKVDNATVENTNTQAPVTASGSQLPATGAKDVTAFFLSAVALLGLGIFFAKKH